jgi:hypothetical protein
VRPRPGAELVIHAIQIEQRPGARASLRALCFRPHCRFKTRKDKESYVVEAIVGRDPNPEGGWRYLIKWDR